MTKTEQIWALSPCGSDPLWAPARGDAPAADVADAADAREVARLVERVNASFFPSAAGVVRALIDLGDVAADIDATRAELAGPRALAALDAARAELDALAGASDALYARLVRFHDRIAALAAAAHATK